MCICINTHVISLVQPAYNATGWMERIKGNALKGASVLLLAFVAYHVALGVCVCVCVCVVCVVMVYVRGRARGRGCLCALVHTVVYSMTVRL